MEELESLLVSVKAWASKLLEALGLCRSDCAALEAQVAEKQTEIDRLLIELSKLPQPEPEEKPFDLGPILAMVSEFKQAIDAIRQDADNRHREISAAQTDLRNLLVSLGNRLDVIASRAVPDMSAVAGLPAFINKVNVDLDYFRSKLNRLPF